MLPRYLRNVPRVPLSTDEYMRVSVQMLTAISEEVSSYSIMGLTLNEIKADKSTRIFVDITNKILVKKEYTNFECRKFILLFFENKCTHLKLVLQTDNKIEYILRKA